jgi:anti-sigma regulatory factor (Ser/Thr protein kinase)/serine/threonine protein phosphatase PrpC
MMQASMPNLPPVLIAVVHGSDVSEARQRAQVMALAIGFDETASAEVALAVSELGANLLRHTKGGTLTLTPLVDGRRVGMQVISQDRGPGIADVEQALTDGFSTTGGLGYGLGAVNRLMDELDIVSEPGTSGGTRIACKRWLRVDVRRTMPGPLTFGAASRPHPRMTENGDAFVIKCWGEGALVAVIDGLGHGPFAQHAAQTARQYVESHVDQPLDLIFRGVGRACRATRGVVMALARFDRDGTQLTFASIGNIEARVFGSVEPMNFAVRRGIVGVNAPNPAVTQHRWQPNYLLVLHSDGLTTRWRWEDFPGLGRTSASVIARRLLQALAKDDDDATVLVVKGGDETR